MSQPINRSVIRYEGSQAERLALGPQSAEFKKIIEWVEPGGNVFEQRLDGSWTQTSFGGAVGVHNLPPLPSDYTGDTNFATTGTALAIPTGAKSISLSNVDATNYARFAFGESSAAAITNAANGKRLYPMAAGSNTRAQFSMGVPAGMTHIAGVANTAAVIVDVQWEV